MARVNRRPLRRDITTSPETVPADHTMLGRDDRPAPGALTLPVYTP